MYPIYCVCYINITYKRYHTVLNLRLKTPDVLSLQNIVHCEIYVAVKS